MESIAGRMQVRQAPVKEPQESGEFLGVPPTVGVGLTESDAPATQHARVDARVVNLHECVKRRRDRDRARLPESSSVSGLDELDGASRDVGEQLCAEPAGDRVADHRVASERSLPVVSRAVGCR